MGLDYAHCRARTVCGVDHTFDGGMRGVVQPFGHHGICAHAYVHLRTWLFVCATNMLRWSFSETYDSITHSLTHSTGLAIGAKVNPEDSTAAIKNFITSTFHELEFKGEHSVRQTRVDSPVDSSVIDVALITHSTCFPTGRRALRRVRSPWVGPGVWSHGASQARFQPAGLHCLPNLARAGL